MRIGVDTGGTFTDAVTDGGRTVKLPSTPHDPAAAVTTAVDALGGAAQLAHGTTVATNALLERKLATVALVTNRGFGDLLEIGRQDRPSLYDPRARRPEPLVPRHLRFEADGRLDAAGREIEAVAVGDLPIPSDVDVVVVGLLHADRDPTHELAVAAVLRRRGHAVVCSHEVSPQFREYERLVTTVVDAALRPRCSTYLARLDGMARTVSVMTSAAGLLPLATAAASPARLLLSGPAGGVLAGAAWAAAAGFADAVTFDMGGTSTDVCLVLDGRPAPAGERVVAGFPVRVPSLDVHTIGAGGGSIAAIDSGGALRVGPLSAGADPGPACYGRGGTAATVTDADLVAGRIPAEASFGGQPPLDRLAASAALTRAGVSAEGVLLVVDAAMAEAVRAVTVHRGVDPRDLALVAFGGAGPLHACAVADVLGMAAVVVPPRAGVLSAVGLVAAPDRVDLVRSAPFDPAELGRLAAAEVGDGAVVEVTYDCRYEGQGHELTVASVDAFAEEHRRRNGYVLDAGVEVVAVRAAAWRASPVAVLDLPPPARSGAVAGPAVIAEDDCTIWVDDGWTADVGAGGAWVLRRAP